MSTARRFAAAAMVLIVALAATACSLSAETSPRAIDKKKLPAILEPNATTTTSVPADQGAWARVCFVQQTNKNTPARLDCTPQRLKKITPESLFEALATGPDPAERKSKGYSSIVPTKAQMLGASNVDEKGVMTINLSKEVADISSPNDITMYHQIVKTLTDPRNGLGVRAIALKVDGESKKIPTDNGPKSIATDTDFNAVATQGPPA